MSDILETIKKHDIVTIQHRTKISQYNIKALLERDFSKIKKVQFLGFISILEREFDVDLSTYKEEYFAALGTDHIKTPDVEVFVSEKEPITKGSQRIIIFIVLALFTIAFFAYINFVPDEKKVVRPLNDTVILEAKKELIRVEKEENLIQKMETNTTLAKSDKAEITDEVIMPKVTILPKRRVWMGLIPMAGGKRVQEIIDSAYDLNTSRSWLLVFGHGHIDIEYNKELLEYSSRKKLWFLYEDGQLSEINKEEFKRYNGGKGW
jgi:hypothetical protein